MSGDRVTVSLADGQKEKLMALADANGVTLAFVVRHALGEFLSAREDQQLDLALLDREGTS